MKDEKIGSKAIFLKREDIRKIIAEKYNVPEENIVQSQYSYTVTLEDMEEDGDEDKLETEAEE
jgi:hypothetical protein